MIMAEYELTLVTKTNLSPEELEKFVEELKKIISEKKGEVLNVESWGKKQLAYEIKKQRYGVYTLITFKVEDLGNVKLNLRDDYPDYAKAVARKVQKSSTALGILFCGSGQGMCITANKFKGIRAALAWSVGTAKKSRYDDNSNIICLPAWSINRDQARRIITGWLTTDFSQATRHKRRIKKIY